MGKINFFIFKSASFTFQGLYRFTIIFVVLLLSWNAIARAYNMQPDSSVNEPASTKHVYLGFGGGIKYYSFGGQKENGIAPSGLLSIMFNLSEKEDSFLGIEFNYYRFGYDTKEHIEHIIYVTPFYQSNSDLFWNLYLTTQFGLTVISNNEVLILSNSLGAGLTYQNNDIIIFAKINFNINYFYLANVVTIINLGASIGLC